MELHMLNKITTIAYIKSEIKKGESEKGTIYHKIFCTSKESSGDDYIAYNFTLWGTRFDGILPLLQKDKPIYIEADSKKPHAYTNEKGESKVVMQGNVTKIELLPREKNEYQSNEPMADPVTVEQELPF